MAQTEQDIKRDVVDAMYRDDRVDASEVTVELRDGAVELGGQVPTHRARHAAEQAARFTGGVIDVRNDIVVRSPGTAPVDTEIHDDVRRAIDRDPDIDATDVAVDVDAGWVTLRGSVPTFWQKDLVTEVVLTSRGAIGVDNELAVVPTRTSTDRAIADDIVAELERRMLVDATAVDVTVARGEVTLTGTVPSWTARDTAYDAARRTTGVINVIDDLTISFG